MAGEPEAVIGCFDALPVIAGAFEGRGHTIVAVNAAAREVLGGRDVLGKPASEGIPELVSQEHLALLDRTYETGEPFTATEWRNQLYAQDGAPIVMHMNMELLPWRRADGTIRGVVTLVTDVTHQVEERRAQEAKAADLEDRYFAALDVVTTLQTALLPTRLPVLPRARVAAHYLVAGDEHSAGGDWFDAAVLHDDRLALVVGDVVGHGVVASAVMAQLRAVLLELLSSGTDLPAALARLDRYSVRLSGLSAATLCVTILDPQTGRLEYGTCGHPPPLLLGGDGSTRFLTGASGGPLTSGIAPRVADAHLEVGEVLMLYTDGLVERTGVPLDESLDTMARIASGAVLNRVLPVDAPVSPAQRVCDQTVEMMTRSGYVDDVTTLAVERRAEPVAPLHLQVEADPARLGYTRRTVRKWLADLDVVPTDAMDLQLGVTEVLSNSIEHGYARTIPRPIGVELDLRPDGRLQCTIDDEGVWRTPAPASQDDERQRGLALVSQVSDDLRVRHDAHGTTVTLLKNLRTEAVLASPNHAGPQPLPSGHDLSAFAVEDVTDPVPHLRVAGPVDLGTAADLDAALRRSARGGTLGLIVDLGDVSVLASAGVQALTKVYRLLANHGQTLSLVAGKGTPAQQVLEIAGLGSIADLDDASLP